MRSLRVLPVLLLVTLAACTGTDAPTAEPSPSAAPTPSATPTPAQPAPRPRVGACHRLPYAAAVAPTDERRAVACRRPHTTVTYAVGNLDDAAGVVDGHLLGVDAARVQRQLARTCPAGLAGFAGGTEEDLRTSMLRSVWFSPTVAGAEAGQDWYRCDATVLAAEDRLVTLRAGADLDGALDADDWRERYGMCGTADPARPAFRRVVCSAAHTWEAVATADAAGGAGAAYPGLGALSDTGTDACEAPARARAEDPLTVTWSYEPPTRAQWRDGRRYGLCWVPAT